MDLDKVDLMTEAASLRRGWQAYQARLAVAESERDAARAEAGQLRAEAGLLDEIESAVKGARFQLGGNGPGVRLAGDDESRKSNITFAVGYLDEALAALRAAKGGQ